mgnify:CR=1 FL=1
MEIKNNRSLFLMKFRGTPQLRVLDFLIDNHFFDFPVTEIARESNISYNSIVKFFPSFVKSKIVIKTRKIGKADFFKLNLDNSFVSNLIKLDWMLAKNNLLEEVQMANPLPLK